MADTKQATPELGTCDTPHKLTNLPSKESPWVQQPHPKSDSCTRWKPLASRSGPDRTTPEEKLVIQPQLADVMKDLDYRGIHWDAELAEEGTGWEVAAEPEPQYFETLREALDFFVSLKEPQAGPDRGQQEADKCSLCGSDKRSVRLCEIPWAGGQAHAPIDGEDCILCSSDWHNGPDRGQQDARSVKDYAIEFGGYLATSAEGFLHCHNERFGEADEGTMDEFNDRWRGLNSAIYEFRKRAAKAAREGQAPKGDRIKVEREPGCKCEYAIWTNAKGCPVHDVSDPVQAQKE